MLAEDTSRLERIDKLYTLRLDRYVSLPMLVVVGDQSSGKSSVLEGLTGLPFPRDVGLCTRFPTQVVFNRSKDTQIEGRIMPIDLKSEQDGSAICHLPGMSLEEFSKDQFREIIHNACQKMNVPSSEDLWSEGMKSFSRDVLKIELSSPDYEHFSVLDLPGLSRKPTPGRTTKEDMKVVRELVQRYICNERCIILAVVSANVDIATQEIVQLTEDTDPDGKRTLGVITKPDLVDKGAEEKVFLNCADVMLDGSIRSRGPHESSHPYPSP